MERRKRKSAMENYLDSLTDPPEKLAKMSEFYGGVKAFYKRKWNAPLKLPCVNGVEVNLYRLYDTVMALGGWQKVSHQEKWIDVAEMMGIGEDVANGDYAVKILYMRYLSKYEQNETIGDIDDMMDGELRGRGRQLSFFATNECPISRPSDFVRRDERGNPTNEPDYSRVFRSLISGLPNEIDFGFNICTLLSHPGPRLLRLSHAPYLPTLLAAHCGIFDEDGCDMSDLYEMWKSNTGRDFFSFWANAGIPKEFQELFVPQAANEPVDPDGDYLHGITLEYDVRNPMSWRLNQVVNIIRNFSFEPINRVTLSECWPMMKLLLLCASSRWVPLYTAALDTLSNLASDINLSSLMMAQTSHHAMMRILHDGLESSDKFKLIRCMEILTGLCAYEGNEAVLNDFINPKMLEHIFDVICIRDIMMCVYALECLYQMSEMGDVACDLMCKEPKFIQQLVSMATLEAVSFGPAGLAGMKVVEYQPPQQFGHPQQHMQHGHFPPQQGMPPPHLPPQQHYNQPQHGAPHVVGHPQMMHPQQPNGHHVFPTPQRPPFPQQTPQRAPMPPPATPQTASQQTHAATPQTARPPQMVATPQQPQTPATPQTPAGATKVEKDQLTEQWIRQNCVMDKNHSTPRGELYAAYVDDLRNQYHSLSGSLSMFSNIMRQIYPDVQFRMADNGLMMEAQGVRLIRPHKLAPSTFNTAASPPPPAQQNNPVIKDILAKPAEPLANGVNGKAGGSSDSSRSNTPEAKSEQDSEVKKQNGEEKPLKTKEAEVKPMGDKEGSEKEESEEEKDKPQPESQHELMCEWDGCGKTFAVPSGLLNHCSKEHMMDEPQTCRWPGCDGTTRSRWSLVTHIQDHHAQEHQLKAAAQKRRDGTAPATPLPYRTDVPREIPQHPGYARHAAIDAIRRHAFNFLPRDITDEPEGPVTKSIRLTSCLILRNMARYSAEGRHLLRRHERHLCWLALSRLEASHTLAQLLAELHQSDVADDASSVVEEAAVPEPSPL